MRLADLVAHLLFPDQQNIFISYLCRQCSRNAARSGSDNRYVCSLHFSLHLKIIVLNLIVCNLYVFYLTGRYHHLSSKKRTVRLFSHSSLFLYVILFCCKLVYFRPCYPCITLRRIIFRIHQTVFGAFFQFQIFLYAHTSPSFNIFLMLRKNNVAATVTEIKSETGSAKKTANTLSAKKCGRI